MNENLAQESAAQPLDSPSHEAAPPLWNPEAAGAWSLIFNPVFGSILVLMNWQALKAKEKIRSSQIWVAVSIVMLILVVFFIPSPFSSLVFVTYLLVWYFLAAKPQAKYIRERWGKEYLRRSWLWPLLIAFGVFFIFLCLAFLGVMMQDLASQ